MHISAAIMMQLFCQLSFLRKGTGASCEVLSECREVSCPCACERSVSVVGSGHLRLSHSLVQITEKGVERKMIAGDKLPLWFEEIPVEPGFRPFAKPAEPAQEATTAA